jgi:predicted DNA-binding protein
MKPFVFHSLDRVLQCATLTGMEKQSHLSLRIESETMDRLQRLGERRKLPVGWMVRQAVEEYLAREEKKK